MLHPKDLSIFGGWFITKRLMMSGCEAKGLGVKELCLFLAEGLFGIRRSVFELSPVFILLITERSQSEGTYWPHFRFSNLSVFAFL